MVSSDSGGLLLAEVERKTGILAQFSDCFIDHRDAELIEHSVANLVSQRVYGICLGYEDLNDHDRLRHDPVLAAMVGKNDLEGNDRKRGADRGKPLAGKSTLNRLELTPVGATAASRYKKTVASCDAIDRMFVDVFIQAHAQPPAEIILDLDPTDDRVHGHQLGRFFHGYYKDYCYLPLYIFCGDHLLGSRLRPSDCDASLGAVTEVSRIVEQIRAVWPEVQITLRGDSAFARDYIMSWCEANHVDYLFGLQRNDRLTDKLAPQLALARHYHQLTGLPCRLYHEFQYRTHDSWSKSRRVIAKAEHLAKGSNPRFCVTSLSVGDFEMKPLYEEMYCARGEMENRIKDQQLYLFADRTSAEDMRANQLRLYFSSVAYLLLDAFRHLGLADTEMAHAQCHTIREKLLKVGAQIRITHRRFWLRIAKGYPYEKLFRHIYTTIASLPPFSARPITMCNAAKDVLSPAISNSAIS